MRRNTAASGCPNGSTRRRSSARSDQLRGRATSGRLGRLCRFQVSEPVSSTTFFPREPGGWSARRGSSRRGFPPSPWSAVVVSSTENTKVGGVVASTVFLQDDVVDAQRVVFASGVAAFGRSRDGADDLVAELLSGAGVAALRGCASHLVALVGFAAAGAAARSFPDRDVVAAVEAEPQSCHRFSPCP